MKILVSGSTGLIGSALVECVRGKAHEVIRLARSQGHTAEREVLWNPSTGTIEPGELEGLDAVVHLAGENIAAGRWTRSRKRAIRDSRILSTRLLSEALAKLERPPKVLVSTSAIGYYGNRGDELLNEDTAPGPDFLADVCKAWEEAAAPAAAKGIRVVHPRFGVVLSAAGGALKKMLAPFQMGVGGILGNGRQYMSWIEIGDAVEAVHHLLVTESLRGPVNVVSPRPVTNRTFTKTLGAVLRRPTVFPMPSPMVRLVFGEMGEGLLLASQRVEPRKLIASAYAFRYPDLEGALRHRLGK
ncbi:MAG: TIGR01777 family protein [Candidatus Hydrogenedentes bacterium]|nr:TIGR01777 family protein [Candidatus Hydrogenedentota bacterium]